MKTAFPSGLSLRFLPCLALVAASWTLGATSHAVNTHFSSAQGFLGGDSAFEGQFFFNNGFATYSDIFSGPGRVETSSASANLSGGDLRMTAAATVNAGQTLEEHAVTSVISAFGDTIGFNGSGAGDVAARFTLSGSWATSTPGDSSIENTSYLRVYFLKPGSFDTPSILAANNVVSQAIWGVGPGAVVGPLLSNPVPYSGYISSFPATVSFPVPISSLNQGFQVAIVLQTVMDGTAVDGSGLSWNVNLGNTVEAELVAPAGYTLSSSGGLPVPEPSSLLLSLVGFVGLAWRRGSAR